MLYETIESCFQLMYDKYGFYLKKSSSPGTLSGCIERSLWKVIITLSTSNEVVEVFEKTLTGGFSCINTSLFFDIELLLPNANNMR